MSNYMCRCCNKEPISDPFVLGGHNEMECALQYLSHIPKTDIGEPIVPGKHYYDTSLEHNVLVTSIVNFNACPGMDGDGQEAYSHPLTDCHHECDNFLDTANLTSELEGQD